jgi:cytochrome c biogenesis protein CcmG, thiol:disulfide interchange protein DsbE
MPFDLKLSTRRDAIRAATAIGVAGVLTKLLETPAHASTLKLNEPAPPATLLTLDGQRIATADLLGQVVILTFWATWCIPCREELPLLSSYAAGHAAQGLQVLGFSLDAPDQLKQVRAVAKQLSFPVGLMSDDSAPGYGRIWRLPVNFTIDRKGRLNSNGWKEQHPTWTPERLERIVTPLLDTVS